VWGGLSFTSPERRRQLSLTSPIGDLFPSSQMVGFPRWGGNMQLLTTQQVADMLGVKPSTLRNWRCAKTGPPFIRITKRSVKYAQADIDRYVAERTVTPFRAG
jgi:predicted DNA-binding transcriptional regulator AlpA